MSIDYIFDDGKYQLYEGGAKLSDGTLKKSIRFKRPDSAHVIARTDTNDILVIREYRPFWNDYIWMLPGGNIDKESDSLEGAMRELREETGLGAHKIKHYFDSKYSEVLDFIAHVFIAHDLYSDPLPQDEHEEIEVHTLSLAQALENIENSSHVHTISAYALRRYKDEFDL